MVDLAWKYFTYLGYCGGAIDVSQWGSGMLL